ncbi:MAG TPA: precorrin-2 C(20)-methyltransferase [Acidimicrobiales bacterium]|nr:precorrin-2 C(20)-methyltransferase [Acidimicrobiales bacterium]
MSSGSRCESGAAAPPCALTGVGMGPGDAELVTLQAVRVLRRADRVFAPSTAVDAVGRAESILRQVCPEVTVERLAFEMTAGEARHTALAAAAHRVCESLDTGEDVAFVTLGDPNVYSTFPALAAAVRERRPGTPVRTVPGITAFQALAARSGTVLLAGTERLSLVTALDGPEPLDTVVDDPRAAVVVYKGGRHLPAVAKRLADAGRLDGAVAGELLGLPGERVLPAADMAEGPASYLVTVIVPPADRGPAGASP